MYYEQQEPEFKCENCGILGDENLEEGPVFYTCRACGLCYGRVTRETYYRAPREWEENAERDVTYFPKRKRGKDGQIIRGKASKEPRYKPVFHFKERIAQWTCSEPGILDPTIIPMFKMAMDSGRYGLPEEATRATIMSMCSDLHLCKYKENWKTILRTITGREFDYPTVELQEKCVELFEKIYQKFEDKVKLQTLKLKGSGGRPRHNVMHLNHTMRKILEALGHFEWHREFPTLSTPSKVKCVDDILAEIFQELGLPFERTVIMIPPKRRKKIKRKASKAEHDLEVDIMLRLRFLHTYNRPPEWTDEQWENLMNAYVEQNKNNPDVLRVTTDEIIGIQKCQKFMDSMKNKENIL